jgi:4,5-dihydroxyphthalate decarboxylase
VLSFESTDEVAPLKLTLACWNYDRTRALADGRVRPDGIDLTYLNLPVEETFFRMVRHREFDVAELSLSSYVLSLFQNDAPFVAIPVFPSRSFRHSCIYVHADSGIRTPSDLVNRRVGCPEFQLTACVWIRGLLADDHGVPFDGVTYVIGGQEQPGRREKLPLDLPSSIRIERIGPDATLAAMLERGDIDALYTPRMPSTFRSGCRVRRLFEDYAQTERDYFRRTAIFPIMHVVAIRRGLYERHRWIAQSLQKAFAAAQRETYTDLAETAASKAMLPWLTAHVEETRREMGDDFWPYGLDRNRRALETFLRYSHEQGLAKRLLTPDDLFAPETLESFRI